MSSETGVGYAKSQIRKKLINWKTKYRQRQVNLHVEFHLNRNLSLQNPGNEEVMLIVSGISENSEPS